MVNINCVRSFATTQHSRILNRSARILSVGMVIGLLAAGCITNSVWAVQNYTEESYVITVSAGDLDRKGSVVEFYLSDSLPSGVYLLEQSSGESVLLQVEEGGRAVLIVESLPAGEQQRFILHPGNRTENTVTSTSYHMDYNTITLRKNDRDVLSYFYRDNDPPVELDEDLYRRGGYIHPVKTPGGAVVTNHLNVEGHPHHSGIWSAWTRTSFQGRTPDFWNPHAHSGRVDQADSLDRAWSGPVETGFRTRHYFKDTTAEPLVTALNEQWDVRLYRTGGESYHLFDLRLTQTVNTSHPLVLEEHLYGGVGFRGHPDWDDPENVTFLTSEGLGRIDGHATRSRWIHIGGEVGGEMAGVAILGHPENVRHPQPMRIHPEDVFFNYAPSQMGEFVIDPGNPNSMRYRYITYDREPDSEELERLWHDFAYPPGVTVRRHESP